MFGKMRFSVGALLQRRNSPPLQACVVAPRALLCAQHNRRPHGCTAMGPFSALLGPSLVASSASDGKIKRFDTHRTDDALAGKHVGLFFGASWRVRARARTCVLCCPGARARRGTARHVALAWRACGGADDGGAARRSEEARAFATQLADAWRAVAAAAGKGTAPFTVVLVSSDRSVDAFAAFLAASPPSWRALPYTDALKAKAAALATQFMARAAAPLPPPCCQRVANTLTRHARVLTPPPRLARCRR
jgi:hypothetical protein